MRITTFKLALLALAASTALARHGHHSHHNHRRGLHDAQLPHKVPLLAETKDNATLAPNLELRDLLVRQSGMTSPGQTGGGSSTSSSGDFTCGPDKPCGNGACCGESGWCGYSPTYCGDGCQSNCDAKAECGQFAATPGKGCPLNVCCSEFGFCGTTQDFCGDGCQSNCDVPNPPSSKSDTQTKIIGYYEGWSQNHACGTMSPSEIPVQFLTHLNFAFGYITPGDFRITTMPDFGPELFGQVTDLKQRNPDMKVLIALGGWTFNDPGSTQTVFSDLCSSAANRARFIENLEGFLTQYGFDGVDIDWEYPGADDRGGKPDDGENFTTLLKEIKASFGRRYLLTFTAPTSYWYLRHFDIKASSEAVDWINLMSYDLHGVWDRDNPIGNNVLAHTNITEIDSALDLFWRTDVSPDKIVLGIGFYGRSFKLQDPACWQPGCAFSGPGDAGPCSDTPGILSYKEIQDTLSSTKAKPKYDPEAKVQYMVYGQNNWISFDDEKTFQDKVDFANGRGLNGLMVWAIDIDDGKGSAIRALTGNRQVSDSNDLAQYLNANDPFKSHTTGDPTQCYITDCKEFCDPGWTAVGRANTDKDGKNRCNAGKPEQARYICCPSFSGPMPDQCRWDDSRSSAAKTDCSGKCKIGEIELVDDSYGWVGDVNTGHYGDRCWRGYKTFCCTAGNADRYLDICTWSECNEGCPNDKPHVLTTDTGGPKSNSRCSKPDGGNGGGGSPFDPEPSAGNRKLCCPREDSFKNCKWSSGKVCSTTCPVNQITLDTDPRGPNADGHTCDNGREQAFCCDPPGGTDRPFTPFNLENLFPPEYLPPADAIPTYDLVSFSGAYGSVIHAEDPNLSGVAFFLIAGSSTAVTSMHKRDNSGLVFLSCPSNVLDRPNDEKQVARVTCTDDDVESCFRVLEGGVEGTVVHMPEECGGPSFARAISLEASTDQSVPMRLVRRRPTSLVYDFAFDFNTALIRRDAGDYSIRMDFSNVPGYWNAVVDSPGAGSKKRDLQELVKRFYGDSESWYDKFNHLTTNDRSADEIDIDLKHLVYDVDETCPVEGGDSVDEGISVGVLGKSDVNLYYGFSMIATWPPTGKVAIHQAAGFVRPEGTTDATFKVGGQGGFDSSASLQGDTMSKTFGVASTKGHNVFKGWAWFQGYQETGVTLKSSGGESGTVTFDGYMEGRIKSEWGRNFINFPIGAAGEPRIGTGEGERRADQVSLGDNELNFVKQTPSGSITVSSTLKLGLQVGMEFSRPWQGAAPGDLPDMSVSREVLSRFLIDNTATQACLSVSLGTEQKSHLRRGSSVGWVDSDDKTYVQELTQAGSKRCYDASSTKKREAVNETAALASRSQTDLAIRAAGNGKPGAGLRLHDVTFDALAVALRCNGCGSCTELGRGRTPCCGCACLICKYGPATTQRDEDVLDSGSTVVSKRAVRRTVENGGASAALMDRDDAYAADRAALEHNGESEAGRMVAIDRSRPNEAIHLAALSKLGERDDIFDSDDEFTNLTLHLLDPRAPEDLSVKAKPVKFCGELTKSEPYPSYPNMEKPNNPKKPTFDNSRLTANIRKYYHNSTSDCTSWAVSIQPQSDQIYRTDLNGALGPQLYQTEHPFEAQTIKRFFEEWLPNHAASQRQCSWTRPNIIFDINPYPGATHSIAKLAALELGSRARQDRLTVFLTNSNLMKGKLFSAKAAINTGYFNDMLPGDEQLAYAKEYGMIFTYMNTDGAWAAFCDTYNGIRTVFANFDTSHPGTDLAGEWRKFVNAELTRISRKGREDATFLYNTRKAVPGFWRLWWAAKWTYVMSTLGPFGSIGFVQSCPNL